ncbi:hypothetical protein MOKP64_49430 [Mycobacterium avium subsp. hominissuis]
MTFAPRRFGAGEGVEHQLAPGERRFDREVCVPAAETDTCGCRTVSGSQHAVAQLGESVSMVVNAPRMRLTSPGRITDIPGRAAETSHAAGKSRRAGWAMHLTPSK